MSDRRTIRGASDMAIGVTGGTKPLLARHPLVSYFLIAYAYSWLAWMPLVLSEDGAGLLPYFSAEADIRHPILGATPLNIQDRYSSMVERLRPQLVRLSPVERV